MQFKHRISRRRVQILASAALVGPVVLAGTRFGVDIVAKAAGIPTNAQGIGGFVNGARALVNPALVMVAAVAPLALIAGGTGVAVRRPPRYADHRHQPRSAAAAGQRHGVDQLTR